VNWLLAVPGDTIPEKLVFEFKAIFRNSGTGRPARATESEIAVSHGVSKWKKLLCSHRRAWNRQPGAARRPLDAGGRPSRQPAGAGSTRLVGGLCPFHPGHRRAFKWPKIHGRRIGSTLAGYCSGANAEPASLFRERFHLTTLVNTPGTPS